MTDSELNRVVLLEITDVWYAVYRNSAKFDCDEFE